MLHMNSLSQYSALPKYHTFLQITYERPPRARCMDIAISLKPNASAYFSYDIPVELAYRFA